MQGPVRSVSNGRGLRTGKLGSEPERWTVRSKATRAPNAATSVLIAASALLLACVTAVVPFVLGALGAFGADVQQAGHASTGRTASSVVSSAAGAKPILGIIGASGNYLSQEKAAGIAAITVQVGWNDIEPTQGTFS